MNNENVSLKKRVVGLVLDIITIGFLFAAFGMLFYLVFIDQRSDMSLGVLSAITVTGLTLLFLVGTVSCMKTKVKNHSLTAGFLAFCAVQLYALISNFVVLGCLLIHLGTVEDTPIRITYAVTVGIVLLGYVANVISLSNGVAAESAEPDEIELSDEEDAEAALLEEDEAEEELSDEDADDAEETPSDADDAEEETEGVDETEDEKAVED